MEEHIKSLINLPNTFIGNAPIDIDDCQWIKSSGGRSEAFFNKDTFNYPTYSIYFRRISHQEANRAAKTIFKQIRNWTDSQSALLTPRMPAFIGTDHKGRSVYTFQIEFQTGGY